MHKTERAEGYLGVRISYDPVSLVGASFRGCPSVEGERETVAGGGRRTHAVTESALAISVETTRSDNVSAISVRRKLTSA